MCKFNVKSSIIERWSVIDAVTLRAPGRNVLYSETFAVKDGLRSSYILQARHSHMIPGSCSIYGCPEGNQVGIFQKRSEETWVSFTSEQPSDWRDIRWFLNFLKLLSLNCDGLRNDLFCKVEFSDFSNFMSKAPVTDECPHRSRALKEI